MNVINYVNVCNIVSNIKIKTSAELLAVGFWRLANVASGKRNQTNRERKQTA
jgi:hypothetical protein